MTTVHELHDKAMELADQAFAARREGDVLMAGQLFRQAFNFESEAAQQVANDYSNEPTRSVLLRSAATLALDCGEVRIAERLVASALAGDPPPELADELRDLIVKLVEMQRSA